MKNSNDTIGNRTRNLPTCSAVPQPTVPPAACPDLHRWLFKKRLLNLQYTRRVYIEIDGVRRYEWTLQCVTMFHTDCTRFIISSVIRVCPLWPRSSALSSCLVVDLSSLLFLHVFLSSLLRCSHASLFLFPLTYVNYCKYLPFRPLYSGVRWELCLGS